MEWLTDYKIPVGRTAKSVFDWMNDNLGGMFDAISAALEAMIDGILWLLQAPHPFVIIGFSSS
jgi:glycine betaine/proline transport system permease protein